LSKTSSINLPHFHLQEFHDSCADDIKLALLLYHCFQQGDQDELCAGDADLLRLFEQIVLAAKRLETAMVQAKRRHPHQLNIPKAETEAGPHYSRPRRRPRDRKSNAAEEEEPGFLDFGIRTKHEVENKIPAGMDPSDYWMEVFNLSDSDTEGSGNNNNEDNNRADANGNTRASNAIFATNANNRAKARLGANGNPSSGKAKGKHDNWKDATKEDSSIDFVRGHWDLGLRNTVLGSID
jgi:hypothetical protein